MTHDAWLAVAVPLWSLVLAGTTALALGTLLVRAHHPRQRRVLLLMPAFVEKYWLAGFLQIVMHLLDSHGFDAVIKFPRTDFSGHDQSLHLAAAQNRSREYSGALIIPAAPESTQTELLAFCSAADLPVIFVDTKPFANAGDYPLQTAFVGSDQIAIGTIAARWAAAHLSHSRKKRPVILVVHGVVQHDRERAFMATLKTVLPGASVTEAQGGFDRATAREIVTRRLRSAGGSDLDLVFCTCDEMALGAVDAVHEEEFAGRAHPSLTIIGVDGTSEAKAVIKTGSAPLRATVAQDTRQMAELAVRMLLKAINNEQVPTETFLQVAVYPPS